MSRHYLNASKKRLNLGPVAWAKWQRQWFRRQRGMIAGGPAFACGDRRRPLIRNGRKP